MNRDPPPNQPPAERGPLDELTTFLSSIPPITRLLFCGSLGLSIISRFGLIDIKSLALIWPLVWKNLQIWRLATSFLAFPVGWGYFMTLYFLYKYSWSLEESVYANRKADYAFLVLFCMIVTLPVAVMFNVYLLLECLVMALLYVWAMENREQVVSFFFGLQFKAMYLPIVLIGFDVLTGAPFMDKAIGLAVGHLFYFLDKMYPQQNNGERILSTPAFLTRLFEQNAGGVGVPAGAGRGQRLGTAPAGGAGGYRAVPTANTRGATTGAAGAAGAGEGMRYRWGGGNRLGTD